MYRNDSLFFLQTILECRELVNSSINFFSLATLIINLIGGFGEESSLTFNYIILQVVQEVKGLFKVFWSVRQDSNLHDTDLQSVA